MKRTTILWTLILFFLLAIGFNSCGSSNGDNAITSESSSTSTISQAASSSSFAAYEPNPAATYIDVVACHGVNSDTMTSVQEGDLLIALEAGTTVKIIHNQDGTKSVCTQSGLAQLERL